MVGTLRDQSVYRRLQIGAGGQCGKIPSSDVSATGFGDCAGPIDSTLIKANPITVVFIVVFIDTLRWLTNYVVASTYSKYNFIGTKELIIK